MQAPPDSIGVESEARFISWAAEHVNVCCPDERFDAALPHEGGKNSLATSQLLN